MDWIDNKSLRFLEPIFGDFDFYIPYYIDDELDARADLNPGRRLERPS